MIFLKHKNILVTGASSGIGKECAIQASELGANVICIGRNENKLNETINSLSEGKHLKYSSDITNYDGLEDIISDAVSKVGKISGFIHSAGIENTIPLNKMNKEKYDSTFSVNVFSAFEISKILSKKKYLCPDGASFIFISSVMGMLGQAGKVGYCGSKSALIGGARAMAVELAKKKIRVNCIMPGVVETEMTKHMFESLPKESVKGIKNRAPLGTGEPRDVSNLTSFLLSDNSKWITGTEMFIDGGYHTL